MSKYKTAPDPTYTGWPPGIPYIIGNEGCERFSFYGMKAILKVYLVFLYVQHGLTDTLAEQRSNAVSHFFIMGVYAFPMIGAVISDRLAGKYATIIWLSLVYCAGHAALAAFEGNLPGVYLGLTLICIGSGGIKPCVSAHVGDQFGRANWDKLQRTFLVFYFIINFGSVFATILIPLFKEWWGWSVAFAVPGVLMGIATFVFWLGRHTFVHVPPQPGGRLGMLDAVSSSLLLMTFGSFFLTMDQPWSVKLSVAAASFVAGLVLFSFRQRLRPDDGFVAVLAYSLKAWLTGREQDPLPQARAETGRARSVGAEAADSLREHPFFGPAVRRFGHEAAEGPVAVLKIISIFFLVSIFWALFDQHATTWIQQAKMMDRSIPLPWGGEQELLREQMPFVNPLLVMLIIPFTAYVLYPGIERAGIRMTPLRRMTAGMLLTGTSFVACALIQERLDAGIELHVAWQLIPYLLLTLSEVMVSITGLEFAYTQAPRRMKSTIMSFWLATVALGNFIAGLIFDQFPEGYPLVRFFWIFAAMMFGAGVLFMFRAAFYRYKDYTQ